MRSSLRLRRLVRRVRIGFKQGKDQSDDGAALQIPGVNNLETVYCVNFFADARGGGAPPGRAAVRTRPVRGGWIEVDSEDAVLDASLVLKVDNAFAASAAPIPLTARVFGLPGTPPAR